MSGELLTAYSRAQRSIFRLETLQEYRAPDEDPALAAFRAGQPLVPSKGKATYLTMLRDAVNLRRCSVQRVHVVQEPLSEYLSYELTWSYQPNVQAGEEIGIVLVRQNWPAGLPQRDYWLLDDSALFSMRYAADGTWLGTDRITNPTEISFACSWRDLARRLAVPWSTFVHSRPELAQHLQPVPRAS